MAVFNVAGYLIEERRRWPVITASHGDNIPYKYYISNNEPVFQTRIKTIILNYNYKCA